MHSWHFWYSGPADGPTQMALDSSLLAAHEQGVVPNVFRLYTWYPPAVSLGYHQDPGRELHLDRLAARGIGVAKRPTGGRAILHADELTYAVVAPVADGRLGGSLAASHAAISRIFRSALRQVGVRAELAAPRSAALRPVAAVGAAAPCFAAPTRSELVAGGRKIMGSAQRRVGRSFLQHGSLLLGDAHLDLAEFLRIPPTAVTEWRNRLRADTTTVTHEAGRRVPLSELIEALAGAIAEAGMADRVRFTQWPPHGGAPARPRPVG